MVLCKRECCRNVAQALGAMLVVGIISSRLSHFLCGVLRSISDMGYSFLMVEALASIVFVFIDKFAQMAKERIGIYQ